MARTIPLLTLALAAPLVAADPAATCQTISQKISNASAVLYSNLGLNLQFQQDIHHWYTTSSQTPACVVEVGSVQDTAITMQIIGQTRTPFAVRSGGHASNPGFSSTTGVHIAFPRMKQVNLSADKSTVEIGMGMTWAEVYQKLEGTGVNVVGGRTQGPGVGGFTLGGGYSWKTNQYGLTCDNVKSFTLVLPNGTVTAVESSKPDLFFALKGGLNRFGVVTSAVYYTHPQVPQIYGGSVLYTPDRLNDILNATHSFFVNNKDPKAQIITTLFGSPTGATPFVLFFNDGPNRPDSFAPFDSLIQLGALSQQSFSNYVASFPSGLITNPRGTFNTLSTSKLTPGFLSAVANETAYWGSQMLLHGGTSVSYDVEPFDTNYGSHATDSAFPHSDSPLPLNLYFAWNDASQDAFWNNALRTSIARLKQVAIAEGIYPGDYTAYPNYAISNTTSESLYGQTNAARLRRVKAAVDPSNIMGLAGGFTI